MTNPSGAVFVPPPPADDDAPIMVRNTHGGPVVHQFGKNADQAVEWAGAGDINGGDIQAMDRSVLKHPRFRDALIRGILVVENDDAEIQRVLGAQRNEWEQRQERARNASREALDLTPQEDLLMVACIAPAGPNTRKPCGTEFAMRAKEQDRRPPLCDAHKPLANQYVSEETEEFNKDTGRMSVIWKKIPITARQKQER